MTNTVLLMLETFTQAWNRHDLETIMRLSTHDCEFWAAAGPEASGARHIGPAAVAKAYQAIFSLYPDAQWSNGHLTMISKERALSEWTFTATAPDGKALEVLGLDILELSDGKVWIKNSLRKNRLS